MAEAARADPEHAPAGLTATAGLDFEDLLDDVHTERPLEHPAAYLKDARLVLRLNTRGGALKGPCPNLGEPRAAPYSADCAFPR